ncbi:patatin-like phospholipase family protein [Bradyrhizobium sp. LMTR 3]|uniref:patatin-like phospholipase family protein n=1 Tax=Bradyrhizobium sp. LMTR 3 TaxID=189873 RepID=UPI0008105DCA|nr:patatin-like phospholipase family protein [Bradyrhizobium sp. LMTR 3]OCK54829.1 hypothetical protein LMTR3_08470 [Bradyrhizobium sp. LMTR 3]
MFSKSAIGKAALSDFIRQHNSRAEPESTADHDERMRERAEEIIKAERNHIVPAGEQAQETIWCGIGLSGGGIRSASLALGVLQALAEAGLLGRFQYISSVSGGGYVASALQWWWSRGRETGGSKVNEGPDSQTLFGTSPTNFPYGSARPKPGRGNNSSNPTPTQRGVDNLAFLRSHSSFLVPGNGLNLWSMFGVLFRTIVISLLTWLPLLTLLALLVFAANVFVLNPIANKLDLWSPIGKLVPDAWHETQPLPARLDKCLKDADYVPDAAQKPDTAKLVELRKCADIAPASLRRSIPECNQWQMPSCLQKIGAALVAEQAFAVPLSRLRYPAFFAVLLYGFYVMSAAFVSAAVLFALISRSPQDAPSYRERRILGAACVLGLLIGIALTFSSRDPSLLVVILAGIIFLLVAVVTIAADLLTDASLNPSYWLRRKLEVFLGISFIPTITVLAVSTIPIIPYYVMSGWSKTGTLTGTIGLVGGIASALYGYYTFLRNIVPSLVGHIVATVGAVLYIYMTLVVAYTLSVVMVYPTEFISGATSETLVHVIAILALGSIPLAAIIAFRANINFIGLHRFYRDRLMEAFMPSEASVAATNVNYSPAADSLSIDALRNTSSLGLPYPLINANVILINDLNRKYASRGGDNFIISPLFVGSSATDWQKTGEYIKMNGPLTLPSAMAASGAAASASAGYIGTGITMNTLVSAVMSLLNVRLGLWVGNPFHQQARKVRSIPTFWNPGLLSGILGRAHAHDSRFIELTDGGHFENLALYELVRRRLKVILIVDGEADPNISLASLVSATRRIQEDFGATLEFYPDLGPERLIMRAAAGYPEAVRYAKAPFLVGKLTYNHDTEKEGFLIYIKSTLIRQMDFTTAGYLASNPEFPHQSTVDQFFDPIQFDAYRYLGYESARTMIDEVKLARTIAKPQEIADEYCASARADIT